LFFNVIIVIALKVYFDFWNTGERNKHPAGYPNTVINLFVCVCKSREFFYQLSNYRLLREGPAPWS
jgi:hypothetical protein